MNLQSISSNLPVLIRHSTSLSCYGNIYIVNIKEFSLEDSKHFFILFTLYTFPWIEALLITTTGYILIMFPKHIDPPITLNNSILKKHTKNHTKKDPKKPRRGPKRHQ